MKSFVIYKKIKAFKMLNDWKNWCRLCASEEPIIKIESISELLPIIQKFSSQFYGSSSLICNSCFQLLNVINNFTEKCAKVDKMFSDLLLDINTESDSISLKLHYGLENVAIFFNSLYLSGNLNISFSIAMLIF